MKKRTVKRKMWKHKIAAVILSLAMVIPSTVWAAPENSSKSADITVYFTTEKITLGQGLIQEPVKVVVPKDSSVADVTQEVLGDEKTDVKTDSLQGDYYLRYVKDGGEPEGWDKSKIPAKIMAALNNSSESDPAGQTSYTGLRNSKEWLGEFDYSGQSGWMFTKNNQGIEKGADQIKVSDGDVVRLQFSVYGYGADIMDQSDWGAASLADYANKDELIKELADCTDKTSDTFKAALAVLNDWDAAQSEVDKAAESLTSPQADKSSLKGLQFALDSEGKQLLEFTPSFASDVFNYTVTLPDYITNIYVNPSSAIAEDTLNSWPVAGGSVRTMKSDNWNQFSASQDMYIRIVPAAGGDEVSYMISYKKAASLKSLTVDDTMKPVFDKEVKEYRAYIPADSKTVSVTAEGYRSSYSIEAGGIKGDSGEAIEVPVTWDANGEMKVPVKAVSKDMDSIEYTLTLTKEPQENEPTIVLQPKAGQIYVDTDTELDPIKVRASGNGEISYQWYENDKNSTEGGKKIEGAAEASYTPVLSGKQVEKSENHYYYCVVSNTVGGKTYTQNSEVVYITVKPDPTPYNIKIAPVDGSAVPADGYKYNVGDETKELKVTFDTRAEGTKDTLDIDYVWSTGTEAGSPSGGTYGSETYTYKASVNSRRYVSVKLYITQDGRRFGDSYSNEILYTVSAEADDIQVPAFASEFADKEYLTGAATIPFSSAIRYGSTHQNSTQTYQWFESTDGVKFTPVGEAETYKSTAVSYKPESSDVPAVKYYKCVATNTVNSFNGKTYAITGESTVAKVSFKTLDQMVDEELWDGKGTETDPYQLNDLDDLKLIQTIVNEKGIDLSGSHFKMMKDITIPADWEPIGTGTTTGSGKNLKPFAGIFDGNNCTLTVEKGGQTLFGYVRGAVIKNLNIYGEQIEGYGVIAKYYVDYGPSGNYSDWLASGGVTATIDRVTLKAGTKTLKAGFYGGYASAANIVNISNSTIEKGVVIGYDKEQVKIGSFTGNNTGTINNCHSYAEVYGKNYVGGIAGAKGEAMGTSRVLNSSFQGKIEASGNYVGGIYGSGYTSSSAPNTPCVSIENCFVSADITGATYVGGILGGEPVSKQCWANGIGYIRNNHFYGTLKGDVTGGIIGFMKSLDRYNIISNNYYVDTCGTDKGIGQVESIDTSQKIEREDAVYTMTESYCRDDDPLGKDAHKLAKAASAEEFSDGTITDALNAGEGSSKNWGQGTKYPVFEKEITVYISSLEVTDYKAEYKEGEEFTSEGIKVIAHMSDGTSKEIPADQVTFSGFVNTPGTWTITASYEGATKMFTVKVTAMTDEDYAKKVSDAIAEIGTVTLESKEAIQAAREAYDQLSEDQKALVENYEVLTAAEETYAKLQEEAEKEEADQKAARAVEDAIAEIGTVTLESKEAIQAAREAYDQLSEDQKALVKNYEVLTAAEETYAKLQEEAEKAEADQKAAQAVEKAIAEIGTVTLESKEAIQSAREAYDQLSEDQKALVKNYEVLTAAEETYAKLQEEAEKPEKPEKPQNPEETEKPEKPQNPEETEKPEKPQKPENPESPTDQKPDGTDQDQNKAPDKEQQEDTTDVVKTGDAQHIVLWFGAAGIAGVGILVLTQRKKNTK
ncbi:Bacterial Ig-like domain (group 3) [uncultured Roseburia sp.]|uniref:Bacterial Ig-like domain-containing protein n=1 Tax=Brotonthovivens ammoniilytica TaxID=2981725 RepID=A0ABT2TLQ0_9FIRM|nr:bacterial Ig-like domain-containing protein [Brotonthovivens ammoniilytica]MCU6762616.1 bacterial Ig-like domain-containing protein [Brotonthovivens ammoniilytica]SCI77459.1 Bacterial Ig-like domain (group 3) [uncultured Roseburia sp.]